MGRGKRKQESNGTRKRSSNSRNKFSPSLCVQSGYDNSQTQSSGGNVPVVDNTERMNIHVRLQLLSSNTSTGSTSYYENQSRTDTRRFSIPEIKISSEENEDVCEQCVQETKSSVSRKHLERPSSARSEGYAARLETPNYGETRRHSLPAMKIGHGSTEKVSPDGSLSGKDISAFYRLWNRPNSPTLLGRGSLEAPKALKRQGPYRCCGCLTHEEHLKRDCANTNN